MTLLIGFLAVSAVIFGWLWQTERGQRLAAEYEADLIHRDFLDLQAAHDVALEDLDYHVEAITQNAMTRHPAGRLSLVKGHGA